MSSAINQTEMTKVQKISENYKRLDVLNARYERLIALNKENDYVTTVTFCDVEVANPRQKQYFRLLKKIYEERGKLWVENRKLSAKTQENLDNAKQAVISLTRNHLFNLTNPTV